MSKKILFISLLSVAIFAGELASSRLPRANEVSPDQRPATNPQQFVANVSRCAVNNQTFCTKNDEYPLDHIEGLLREHANRSTDIFTDVKSNGIHDHVVGIDDDVNEFMCSSYEQVIYQKIGLNLNGEVQFIFNTDDYRQGVRVSKCRNAGNPCEFTEYSPHGVRTECEQQYAYRQLLRLSSTGQPIEDHFAFPAGCSCVVHRG